MPAPWPVLRGLRGATREGGVWTKTRACKSGAELKTAGNRINTFYAPGTPRASSSQELVLADPCLGEEVLVADRTKLSQRPRGLYRRSRTMPVESITYRPEPKLKHILSTFRTDYHSGNIGSSRFAIGRLSFTAHS
jgi:hypothetical protein